MLLLVYTWSQSWLLCSSEYSQLNKYESSVVWNGHAVDVTDVGVSLELAVLVAAVAGDSESAFSSR